MNLQKIFGLLLVITLGTPAFAVTCMPIELTSEQKLEVMDTLYNFECPSMGNGGAEGFSQLCGKMICKKMTSSYTSPGYERFTYQCEIGAASHLPFNYPRPFPLTNKTAETLTTQMKVFGCPETTIPWPGLNEIAGYTYSCRTHFIRYPDPNKFFFEVCNY